VLAPLRIRGLDAEVGRGAEPEPPVVVRRSEECDHALAGGLGDGQECVHQGRCDTLTLVCGEDSERTQSQCGRPERLQPAVGGQDVPHHLTVHDGHQRPVGEEAGILTQHVGQSDLHGFVVRGAVRGREGGPVHLPHRRVVAGSLATDQHRGRLTCSRSG
jgi:hypothetical protein